jgi:AcrR family transcriptional regulator
VTGAEPAARTRPGGRTARVRSAVLDATVRLLLQQGYDKLSFAEVAAVSGIAESTVYRRWHTKPELVADALLDFAEREVPTPDTGRFETDLRTWLAEIAGTLTQPAVTRLLRAMAALDDNLPGVMAARARFYDNRIRRLDAVIARAVRRGETAPDTDAHQLAELLAGPLYLRLLFTARPVDGAFLDRVVTTALRASPPA